MLCRAPRDFPLAVMDLRRLGFDDGVFDAAIAAFVLFHVPGPHLAIRELGRVLRDGGVLGTITWEGDPDFPALRVWSEELDRHGAAPAQPGMAVHEPVSTAARMRDLFEAAGFTDVRTWIRPFDHVHAPEKFLTLRTNLGSGRERYLSLPPEQRDALMRSVRQRFAALSEDSFVDRTAALFAWGRRG